MPPPTTLDDLRRHAVARTLFAPTTLIAAVRRLGFVQADPLRAPARAQDLTLRHRVRDYVAGDLERSYPRLALEEDFFVNYGFLPRATAALMHPRTPPGVWSAERERQAAAVLAFVHERGVVHPREVDAHFDHGSVVNWFGGNSRASTELLDALHYRGRLRTARREGGTRLYALRAPAVAAADSDAALDTLIDVVVAAYAPLPAPSLGRLASLLCGGVPQWKAQRAAALARAHARLPGAEVDGQRWVWPAGEDPRSRRHVAAADDTTLRLLAPFDPIVWDRRRFEHLWGWAYRFEAYTPAARRERGHYALPLLWRGRVIGWANLAVVDGRLMPQLGHVQGKPRDAAYRAALDDELHRLHGFLGLR
ncbi:MAG: crosslink repair DNA glycosylase YcaQ family protein [Rubrivivax sp.]